MSNRPIFQDRDGRIRNVARLEDKVPQRPSEHELARVGTEGLAESIGVTVALRTLNVRPFRDRKE